MRLTRVDSRNIRFIRLLVVNFSGQTHSIAYTNMRGPTPAVLRRRHCALGSPVRPLKPLPDLLRNRQLLLLRGMDSDQAPEVDDDLVNYRLPPGSHPLQDPVAPCLQHTVQMIDVFLRQHAGRRRLWLLPARVVRSAAWQALTASKA